MNWNALTDQVLLGVRGAFGSPATYYPVAGGPSYPVTVVFDRASVQVDPETNAPVRSSKPQAGVRLADFLAAPESDDEIVVAGERYRVVQIEADGQGGATLRLHRAD